MNNANKPNHNEREVITKPIDVGAIAHKNELMLSKILGLVEQGNQRADLGLVNIQSQLEAMKQLNAERHRATQKRIDDMNKSVTSDLAQINMRLAQHEARLNSGDENQKKLYAKAAGTGGLSGAIAATMVKVIDIAITGS